MATLYEVRPESPKIWLSNMCCWKTPSDPPFILEKGEIPTVHLIPVGEQPEAAYQEPKESEEEKVRPKGAKKAEEQEEEKSKKKKTARKKKPALKTRKKK